MSIEVYQSLIPVSRKIYETTNQLSWSLLLPLFALAVLFAYSSDLGIRGAVVVKLKRLFLVAFLLLTFPTIAETLQTFGVEIAKTIDDLTGIDQVLDAAGARAHHFSFNTFSLINMQDDLLIGALVMITYVIVLFARIFLLSFQHFYWLLVVGLGPFFMLCGLFESTVGITKSVFKTMIQLSAWPIIWAVLSCYLRALPFASTYNTDDEFITIITLNLLIAVALLFSPLLVSQLTEGVSLSVGGQLKSGAFKAISMMNPKGALIQNATKVFSASKMMHPPKNISRSDSANNPTKGGK